MVNKTLNKASKVTDMMKDTIEESNQVVAKYEVENK